MPAPTPIIILIKAGAASCEALPEVRLLIFSIIWGAGVLMITSVGGGMLLLSSTSLLIGPVGQCPMLCTSVTRGCMSLPPFRPSLRPPRGQGDGQDQATQKTRCHRSVKVCCIPCLAVDLQWLWTSTCCGSRITKNREMAVDVKWLWISAGCGPQLAEDVQYSSVCGPP